MAQGDNYTRNKIVEMMFGDWFFKKDNTEITLRINNRKVIITTITNGKSTVNEISANSNWTDDKLLFTEKQRYFVKYADEFELVFGEVNAPAVNDILWERKFERV
jgi:hypothetical protein